MPARGEIRIFTPAVELAFAGHPVVGNGLAAGASERGALGRRCARPRARFRCASEGRADLRRRPAGVGAGDSSSCELGSAADVEALAGLAGRAGTRSGSGPGSTRAPALIRERGVRAALRDRRGRGDRIRGDHASRLGSAASSTSARARARGSSPGRSPTGWWRSAGGSSSTSARGAGIAALISRWYGTAQTGAETARSRRLRPAGARGRSGTAAPGHTRARSTED